MAKRLAVQLARSHSLYDGYSGRTAADGRENSEHRGKSDV
jgi:hypothetical protein